MSVSINQICKTGIELTINTLTGSYVPIGTLPYNPDILIFDNQSTVSIGISTDGVNTWRTFPGGECLVLDLRSAQGKAAYYSFQVGTTFFAMGTPGAATFSISYVYTYTQTS